MGLPRVKELREIKSLTGLRGVAAMYVVFHHFFLGLMFTNPFTTFLAHGYLAVDLFFVLSGFVMALNYSHLFEKGFSKAALLTFLSRRIARVYPLYFVATICAFMLILFGWLGDLSLQFLKASLSLNLAMVQAWGFGPSLDGPAWSISAEWAAYLCFPALLSVALFRRALWSWLLAVTCIAVLFLLCALPAEMVHNARPLAILDLHNSYRGMPVWRCLPEFTLGILATRVLGTPVAEWLSYNRWAPTGICAIVLTLISIPRTDLAVVLLFPLLVLCLVSDTNLPGRVLRAGPVHYLGLISYSIYLVHDLLASAMGGIHQYLHARGAAHAQTYAAGFGVFFTLLISIGAYKTIESPGRRFVRKLLEERCLGELRRPTAPAIP